MHFIEDRKLDGDDRKFFEKRLRLRVFARVLQVQEHDPEAVGTEAGKSDEDEDVCGVPKG
jgi:hypothetical protein